MMKVEEPFKPSVAEGLMAYGMSQQTFAFATAGRVQRTTLPALGAEQDARSWNTVERHPMSIGQAKGGAWESVKRLWRGFWRSDDGPPAPTLSSILKTPYSIELVEVPNEGYEEKLSHYISAAPNKTPVETRYGAETAKGAGVALTVLSLAYGGPAAARLAKAGADPRVLARLPTLTPGTGGQMLGQTVGHLKSLSGSNRVGAFRILANEIHQATKGQWTAAEIAAKNATIFAGEGGEALVFDKAGNMFRGNLADRAAFPFVKGGDIQVNYQLLRKIK